MQDITGKVKINFKDAESLRILTKTLLKHDFNLDVDIPPNKLVPALPLRLNYILWIEDLLKHSGIHNLESTHGLDIGIYFSIADMNVIINNNNLFFCFIFKGAGAICIYPLLFSKIYKNKMTCTDIDPDSVDSAIKTIKNNNMESSIKGKFII